VTPASGILLPCYYGNIWHSFGPYTLTISAEVPILGRSVITAFRKTVDLYCSNIFFRPPWDVEKTTMIVNIGTEIENDQRRGLRFLKADA